jgi:DNA-binding transcriptional MerR regulator
MQKALKKYPTIKEAAKALGCNERTLFRYIENEILKK